jgi:TolA-binding protein
MIFRLTSLNYALSLICALSSAAHAQKIFTTDNREIPWADVSLQGANLAWRTKDAATGSEKTLNIPLTNVAKIEFPPPGDLQDAESAINREDYPASVTKAESVLKQFTPFKSTPGSYYTAATLVKLEALARQGTKATAEYDKTRSELKGMTLTNAEQVRMESTEPISDVAKGALLGQAKATIAKLIVKTDDASVLAKLHNLLGDIHAKLSAYPDALEAYLKVSVFYGSQGDQLPIAELGAARALKRMDRLEDAQAMMNGIKERYPTSPQAQAARKELDDLNKALGASLQAKADEEDKAAAETQKEKEAEKEATPAPAPTPATEPAPAEPAMDPAK